MVHVVLFIAMPVLVLVLHLMNLHYYITKCANQQATIDFLITLNKHITVKKNSLTDIAQEINNLSDEEFRKLDKQIIRRGYDDSKN